MRLRWIGLLLAASCGGTPASSRPDASLASDAALQSDASPEESDGASLPSDASLRPDAVPEDSSGDAGADGAASAPFFAVLTQHNDVARTGANLSETVLSAGSLDAGLREVGRAAISDQIYAQPLVLPGVPTDGGASDLVIVASADNRVVALDASNIGAQPIWQIGTKNELGVPDLTSRNVSGNNGILSTPVVDPSTWTLYLVARSCSDTGGVSSVCAETLYALDARSGSILRSVAIAGAVSAPDDAGTDAGTSFNATVQWNRAGLLLVGGRIFIAFAPGPSGDEHEEDFVYHGWLFSYDAADFTAPPSAYCTTTSGRGGGVWQSGNGPASDGNAVFFATGNGIHGPTTYPPSAFPAQPLESEDSIVRLDPPFGPSSATTYFDPRPYLSDGDVFQYMEANDIDLGSAGPLLIPGTSSLIEGGKSGILYVLSQASMQASQPPLSAFTGPALPPGQTLYISNYDGPGLVGSPVAWHPIPAAGDPDGVLIYAWPRGDTLKSFRYRSDSQVVEPYAAAGVPALSSGGILSLSANGNARGSGVIWASTISPTAPPAGHLWALDAITLAVVWDAETPAYAKFTPPTVSGGHVFLAATTNPVGAVDALIDYAP